MSLIFPINFFPSIDYMFALAQGGVQIEAHENYVKQSQRNRMILLSDKGVERLSIPIVGQKGVKTPIGEILIDNSTPWQRQHLRTIRTLYASAPYFEHYFPIIEELYSNPSTHLFEFNLAITERLMRIFKLTQPLVFTSEFMGVDEIPRFDYHYTQVFAEKQDFKHGLSILDYLFCEGPYLEHLEIQQNTL